MNTDRLLDTPWGKGWRPSCIYDIGANKGNWVKHWSMKYDCPFVCIEANDKWPRPRGLAPRHRWFNTVLSDETGKEVQFYDLASTGDSYYQENTAHFSECKPRTVVTETLDDLVSRESLPYPNFMKIDTQGSEVDIFNGAPNVMKNTEVIHVEMPVLEYNKGAPTFTDYIQKLAEYDFYPLALDEVHRSGHYIIQVDMCFVRNDVKLKYFPKRSGDIIL